MLGGRDSHFAKSQFVRQLQGHHCNTSCQVKADTWKQVVWLGWEEATWRSGLITACSGKEAGGLVIMMQIKASSYIVKKTWQKKSHTQHRSAGSQQSSPRKTLLFLPPTHLMSNHWLCCPAHSQGTGQQGSEKGGQQEHYLLVVRWGGNTSSSVQENLPLLLKAGQDPTILSGLWLAPPHF